MASNSSFHSTQDEFESLPQVISTTQVEGEEGEITGGSNEEIRLLRQTLECVQIKLLETRKENRSLQAQLKPERGRQRDENERIREQELMESLAELQAKLTDTQERYHQAVEEVEGLRAQAGRGRGGEPTENQDSHGFTLSKLEHEVQQLKAQLIQSGSEQEEAAHKIRELEEVLKRAEEERWSATEEQEKRAQIEELYKEAQEEIKMLQVNTQKWESPTSMEVADTSSLKG